MACYEDLRALYAATAKERDELRKENEQLKEICQKQAEMNGKMAAMALELDTVTAQRDTLFEEVRGLCHTCKKRNTDFDCEKKCYGHQRGSAWEWKGVAADHG